ncbi:photosynthetic reaction center cytochrome PufC [Rhodopila sp.]|uniref:photosynthetic reaction center cytochrome PufC n=1 Tax=Rhodopila sp. TaxID=2480087 RepID=UPI003D136551
MNFRQQVTLGGAVAAALAVAAVILYQTEWPPMNGIQRGFRGTAMDEIYNPRFVREELAANKIPASLPRLPDVGGKAGAVYKNVQVLKDVSVGNFTRLMASITTWVAPVQGCAYCHDVNNMAADTVYTKVVARRMIQMVQHVNADWKSHVAATGVTCYTCHRGNPVPANVWFDNPGPVQASGFAQIPAGKNHPAAVAEDSSLPFDPFTPFLEHDANIRVIGQTALPTDDRSSIKQTYWTYSLMIHFSQSLGVNCTYCHNTRAFTDWSQSTPQRVNAWYGIRMVRDLNDNYLDPLHTVFPPVRLGADGDSAKVNCATCHNGVYKPLFGVSMVKDFPELQTHP